MNAQDQALGIAILLLMGFVGGRIASKFHFPAITGYIVMGLILGPSFFNIIPIELNESLEVVKILGLGIIALILGGELELKRLKVLGKSVIGIAFLVVVLTFSFVFSFLYLVARLDLAYSLLLGAIATTTSPATVIIVSKELRAKGIFTSTLLGVVALIDMFSVISFGFISVVVNLLQEGYGANAAFMLLEPVYEIGGSLILGFAMGAGLTFLLLKKIKDRHHVLLLLLGIVLLNSALADWLHLSPLLTNMCTGFTLTNLHFRPQWVFNVLEDVELPTFIIFFVLAGASLILSALWDNLGLVLLYLAARTVGLMGGAYLGGVIFKANQTVIKYLGLSMLTKAGLSIGLVVMVQGRFPELAAVVTAVELSVVAVSNILGPLGLKYAFNSSGETGMLKR